MVRSTLRSIQLQTVCNDFHSLICLIDEHCIPNVSDLTKVIINKNNNIIIMYVYKYTIIIVLTFHSSTAQYNAYP